MYARNIDRLEALGDLAAQIVNKHVALQVQPEHYPIVGACLLRAIREVLGAEIATDEVIEAWAAAYGQLADLLIGAEKQIYDSQGRGARRLARRAATSRWCGRKSRATRSPPSTSRPRTASPCSTSSPASTSACA